MASYCPLCAADIPHTTCQMVDRPIRAGFHSVTLSGGDDGQVVTRVEMWPESVS